MPKSTEELKNELRKARGLEGFLVDNQKDPVKIEMALRKILPPERSSDFCHAIVLHGRAVCDARRPNCEACCVKHLCQHFST